MSQVLGHAQGNTMIEFDKDVSDDDDDAVEWFRKLGQFLTDHPEPKSYTSRQVDITHETLESASIHDILDPVFQADCACETIEECDQNVAHLSAAQRRLYAVWWYEAEVNNGGHHQFYSNSYGMFWRDAVDGLEAIGAHSAKQILLDSVARFAEPPSRDRAQRNDQLENLDFDDLNTRLYANNEDLDALMRKFILAHAEDFLFSGILRYENPSEFKLMYGRDGFRWERLTT